MTQKRFILADEDNFELSPNNSSGNAVITYDDSAEHVNIPQLDVSSSLTASQAYFRNDIYVVGTASFGFLNTISSSELKIGDKYIIIQSGATDHATLDGSGILWGSGGVGPTTGALGEQASIRYDGAGDFLAIYPGLSSSYVSASAFAGDGSRLTGISGSQISGIPRVSASNTIYVSATSTDSGSDGSFSAPFASISGALAYVPTKYSAGTAIEIVLLSGSYSGFTLTRHNTYFRSNISTDRERIVRIDGNVIINCTGSALKFSDIVGFDGIFFNGSTNSTSSTVYITGSGGSTTYFNNCYFTSLSTGSLASCLKLDGTYDSNTTGEKLVIKNSTFLSQRAGPNIIDISGGDIEFDSCRLYNNSVGSGCAISASGDVYIGADRLLIETYTNGPAVNFTTTRSPATAQLAITNSSIIIYGSGNAITATGATILLSDIYLGGAGAANIAATAGTILYADIVSLYPGIKPVLTNGYPLNSIIGILSASQISSSFYGSLVGTASYATSGSRAITSSYALTSAQATSASYSLSGSQTISASYAISASNALSSSYAISSSYSLTASQALSSSYAITSSYALTSSQATTASYALSSSNAISASQAISSSYALSTPQATSASYALSSSNALTASFIAYTNISGVLPVSQGGTGLTSLVSGALYIANSTSSLAPLTGSDFALIAWDSATSAWKVSEQAYDLAGDVTGSFSSGSVVFNFKPTRNIAITDLVQSSSSGATVEAYITGTVLTFPGTYSVSVGQLISAAATSAGTDVYFTLQGKLR